MIRFLQTKTLTNMVKVVVAGGSGNVAREVIDKIIAKQKHDIVVFTQRPVDELAIDGVKCVQVDYLNKTSLVDALRGTDVVLCFFASTDQSGVVQKQKVLIDACIEASVRRFAPSEWASCDNEGIPHYAFKSEIRKYLKDINSNQKVLEYTLFQPGLFTNYFGFPYATTKHFSMSQWFVDFENRRAITVGNGDFPLVLSTVQDIAGVVAETLDYEGEWPVDGGICGSRLTLTELIELGKTLRGNMHVESVSLDDLKAGQLKTSWCPIIDHPGIPDEHREAVSRVVMISYLKSVAEGAWNVSDEWNKRLPSYRLTSVEEYLTKIWENKP